MAVFLRNCDRSRQTIAVGLSVLFAMSISGCNPEGSSSATSKQGAASLSETSEQKSPSTEKETTPPVPAPVPVPVPATEDPSTTQAARTLLAECLNIYRSLQRYQDRAELIIQGATTLSLPMNVAWERPNRLGLRTGALQGTWTSTTWEAQSLGAVSPFPNQRLVRPLPGVIDLEWIASDTMGGLLLNPMSKPIQLELLLSSDLSESLVGSDTRLGMLEQAAVQEIECKRITVEKTISSQTMRWVLWIDPNTKLLRKVELPSQFYYPTMTAEELQGVRCSIEFTGASADSPIDWSAWSLPSVPQEVQVTRWVVPPPIASTPILGQVIEPIDFKDANDIVLLDTAAPKKPWNAMVWIPDHAESRPLVDDLLRVRRVLLERELAPLCDIFLVSGAKDANGLKEDLQAWNCDIPLALDKDGSVSKAFQINRGPAMVLIDRSRRVQVAEFVLNPQTIASIPELVAKLRDQQDLASRQLQQDLDNQSRFIGALHRVALDKEQAAKLPEIIEFPFAIYGMRRDWKVELEAPLVSAAGVWYPQAAVVAGAQIPNTRIAMATLDEDGRLQTIALDGTKKLCAKIEPELADGAKRLVMSVDPWTHRWIAIVPEGLPRFWITGLDGGTTSSGVATAYNTQSAESPVCHAWIPQQSATDATVVSKLAIGTSESRLIMIEPTTEQRLDGSFREPPVSIVPGLGTEGQVQDWDVLYADGSLHKISNLARAVLDTSTTSTLEARLDRLSLRSAGGAWYSGMHSRANVPIAGERSIELYLAKLSSGETGIAVANHLHQPLVDRALSVRAEQTKLFGTTRLESGALMGVAAGPSRILHLFSGDLSLMDQASFRSRIMGASIIAHQGDLKLLVALEKEVSCWSIDVPDAIGSGASSGR